MDLQWNDRRTRQFLTNVGLITTNGPLGPDIMAAEWTHHISYSPSLISVSHTKIVLLIFQKDITF
jgi:flavin reductase (DIM6/NTAB) family NADH-FMN oxidoreductase RutF